MKYTIMMFGGIDASEERALEIVSRVVAYTEHPMEVRQVMHESVPA